MVANYFYSQLSYFHLKTLKTNIAILSKSFYPFVCVCALHNNNTITALVAAKEEADANKLAAETETDGIAPTAKTGEPLQLSYHVTFILLFFVYLFNLLVPLPFYSTSYSLRHLTLIAPYLPPSLFPSLLPFYPPSLLTHTRTYNLPVTLFSYPPTSHPPSLSSHPSLLPSYPPSLLSSLPLSFPLTLSSFLTHSSSLPPSLLPSLPPSYPPSLLPPPSPDPHTHTHILIHPHSLLLPLSLIR